MLKEVLIKSNLTVGSAQDFINDCIRKYQIDGDIIDFELTIESSVQFAVGTNATYYTVTILIYDSEGVY